MLVDNNPVSVLKKIDVNLRVTGIGSLPCFEVDEACDLSLEFCPGMPYIPQLPKKDARENLFLQFSENLPCLGQDQQHRKVFFDKTSDEKKTLNAFYDYVSSNCYEYFKISPEYWASFYPMLKKCQDKDVSLIKAQVTGPVTFLLSVTGRDGYPLIFNDELSEAISLGLAMKGLWQASEIKKIGKIPVVFFDEPSLWGLGSAYMPVSIEKAASIVKNMFDFIRERDKQILLGLHCCGNLDWRIPFDSGADIISFDSYSFGENFALYPEEIKRFIQKGGMISFGFVPTAGYRENIGKNEVYDRLVCVFDCFKRKGVSYNLLAESAIFTPACGMGPLSQKNAEKILDLTSFLASKARDEFFKN